MGHLAAYIMITLDGFYEGPNQEFDFWQGLDGEFEQFSFEQLQLADVLVFGHKTYAGMAQYWPSLDAIQSNPKVAPLMNDKSKILVSASAKTANWQSSTIITSMNGLREEKSKCTKNFLILGSPSLTANVAQAGQLDELRIMINPIAIGTGKSLFQTLIQPMPLKLVQTRIFESGNVLLTYRPLVAG